MIDALRDDSGERLRRIEAITDASLAQMDAAAFLDELLERTRLLLEVDTAAILLLDRHSQQLVATVAKGIEDAVRMGFRLSVGRGFAGRVALTRQPVIIKDLQPGDVLNPALQRKGVRSLLGVPMLAGGEVVGVLHVGSLTSRDFTAEDVQLLQLVAERASLASQSRFSAMDQAAALALQRGLLPTRLPLVAGVDLAARYVPGHAAGVGGDWYDVFALPSGWLGIVVGDVCGHGLQAAVVMGRLRSALRAYALEHDDPADVLTRLNRKIRHFEGGSLATALYAMIAPSRDYMVISLAGHLPPIMATDERDANLLEVAVDVPLGVDGTAPRRATSVNLPANALVVFYTDGLVERRDEPIDAGLGRLREAIRLAPPDEVCATIMASVDAQQLTDDVALLTMRRHAASP